MNQLGVPVGGFAPLSTIDWPGRLSAVLFLRGCPWRCPYCHNPELRCVAGKTHVWQDVLAFLEERRGFLEGVVMSGGEPTMHAGLPDVLKEVRAMGFATALHTGGAYPARLEEILSGGLVDWVGFDVKAPFEEYPAITAQADSGARARLSLARLVSSAVPYELRTTVYPPLMSNLSLNHLATDVEQIGGDNLVLQHCRDHDNQPFMHSPDLASLAAEITPRLRRVEVR